MKARARQPWVAGCALLLLLALPPLRTRLEASMSLHMLVHFPLLAYGGFLLASALPDRLRASAERWNNYGITGLVTVTLVTSVLMIPRVLDLVLVDLRFELAKWVALLACGAAFRLSWTRAGWVVQGFFLGNVLPMTAVAGQLYQDSPLRLCNAYLLQDQVWLGQALVALSLVIAGIWITRLFLVLARKGSSSLPV